MHGKALLPSPFTLRRRAHGCDFAKPRTVGLTTRTYRTRIHISSAGTAKSAPAFLSVETQNKFPGACRYRMPPAAASNIGKCGDRMGTSHFRLA
jgi:hypothetical protein